MTKMHKLVEQQLLEQTQALDDEPLRHRIAEVAYLKAAERGFEPGHEWSDWFAAEAEVKAALYSEYS